MIYTYFINKRSLYKIEENNMSSAYQSDWKLVVNRLFYKTFGVTWNSHVNVLVPVSVGETISGKFELLVE